jgi:hypothetical protein
MYLTKEEEEMLNSENETIAKSMEILVALGKVFGAEKLVKVSSAHISGISYQNIGDEGLEWLESLNAKVTVKTTVNPAGMDVKRWKEMDIDGKFYKKQMRILRALQKIGAQLTLTCTPYYLQRPGFGEHLAWAESSAVVYANSLIGAKTNRESGISSIASAITGRTPYYGLHLDENRAPTILVKVRGDLAAAGYKAGMQLQNEIPYFVFERDVTEYELKLLGAAIAATGNVAMFHAEEITPEWNKFEKPKEKIEIEGVIDEKCEPDLIALGCPHLSKEELNLVLELMDGRKAKREFWLFVPKKMVEENRLLIKKIENLGAKVFCDTCMVVSPATERFECVMVNSGKALAYLPKLRKVNVMFGDLKSCVEKATS